MKIALIGAGAVGSYLIWGFENNTEIDMFAGELIKMANELGIEVPFAEYTYHAIKALEEKNDGVIG